MACLPAKCRGQSEGHKRELGRAWVTRGASRSVRGRLEKQPHRDPAACAVTCAAPSLAASAAGCFFAASGYHVVPLAVGDMVGAAVGASVVSAAFSKERSTTIVAVKAAASTCQGRTCVWGVLASGGPTSLSLA